MAGKNDPREGVKQALPVVLALVGPTAAGKTSLALCLAESLKAEIVSADSRQLFRFLDIGTAKPSPQERARILHHFIDIIDPDEEYSAGRFGKEATSCIAERLAVGRPIVIVGGSGLYLRAIVDGLFDGPQKDPEIRARLEERAEREGAGSLLTELRRVDPSAAQRMDVSQTRRIIRALEVYEITGQPISSLHEVQKAAPQFSVRQIGLRWPREELYRRINDRVDSMLDSGLVGEVREILRRGFAPSLQSLNSVGYKEVIAYLNGALTEDQMRSAIQQNTRRFAKRQLTWFRADDRIHWLDVRNGFDVDELSEQCRSLLH